MITLLLNSGLGNQMFQYAFARSLQLDTDNEIGFDLSKFKNDKAGRVYALNNLNITENIKLSNSVLTLIKNKANYKYAKYTGGISYVDGKAVAVRKNYICIMNEYLYKDLTKCRFSKNILVNGFFQNVEYLKKHKAVIQSELRVKTEPDEKNKEMLREIEKCNSVCVHVRRGDYLNDMWKNLQICNYEYYVKGMNLIQEKTQNAVFYIFSNSSDDIKWIKENYDFSGFNVRYVNLNNVDYEELRLMYTCKHFVISNSTFSWWAQFLSDNEKKTVIAPSKWIKGRNISGLYMDTWNIIDTE